MFMVPIFQILIGRKDMTDAQVQTVCTLRGAGSGGQRLKQTVGKMITKSLQKSFAGAPEVVVCYLRT
jgi:hypothetical protein